MPKTLIAYNTFSNRVKFFDVDGDYRHLADLNVGASAPGTDELDRASDKCRQLQAAYDKLSEELTKLLFNEDGTYRADRPILKEPTKDWDYFIQCGILD